MSKPPFLDLLQNGENSKGTTQVVPVGAERPFGTLPGAPMGNIDHRDQPMPWYQATGGGTKNRPR